MSTDPIETIPAAHREIARSALHGAFGTATIGGVWSVTGGASGAGLYRVETRGRAYLLRIEGPASPLLRRNPHRHACTRIAAEAGLAPQVHFLDEAEGVMLTDFIAHHPLRSYPGGQPALVRALGDLLGRLQAAPTFPQLVYYPDLVTRMLDHLGDNGVLSADQVGPYKERLAVVRAACDWDRMDLVPSHNDPNLGNILFDGARLWLIDWESAYRNHPLVDVAIVLDSQAPTPALEDALLQAWLGRAPDAELRERLIQMRSLTRLYYAGFLLDAAAQGAPNARAPGELFLRGFLTGQPMPELTRAISAAIAVEPF